MIVVSYIPVNTMALHRQACQGFATLLCSAFVSRDLVIVCWLMRRQFNVHLDGDKLVLLLFESVIELLRSQYSITVTLDNFLQLDSTTPTKFR
jgi:hypothetical protein